MNRDSERCYRYKRGLLYMSVAGTIFFGFSSIGWPVVALWNADGSFKRPTEAALLFGLFWACWTVLGVWLIFTYVRSRLYISPQGIRQVGCLRVRTIDFDGLSWARWRIIPRGGNLVLSGQDGKLTLYFHSFSRAAQREMIEFLRSLIDEHIQQGWELFESRIFARLQTSAARQEDAREEHAPAGRD